MGESEFVHIQRPQETEMENLESWPPVETDISKVDEYEEKLGIALKQAGWEEFDILDVTLVFREWLLNAMLHGNMGITRAEGEPDEIWNKRIQEAQNKPEVKAKKVYFKVSISPRRLVVEIQDEGKDSPEFWKEEEKPRTKEEELRWFSNRGRTIGRAFTNKMDFEKNIQGVKVTFVRDLDVPLPEIKE